MGIIPFGRGAPNRGRILPEVSGYVAIGFEATVKGDRVPLA